VSQQFRKVDSYEELFTVSKEDPKQAICKCLWEENRASSLDRKEDYLVTRQKWVCLWGKTRHSCWSDCTESVVDNNLKDAVLCSIKPLLSELVFISTSSNATVLRYTFYILRWVKETKGKVLDPIIWCIKEHMLYFIQELNRVRSPWNRDSGTRPRKLHLYTRMWTKPQTLYTPLDRKQHSKSNWQIGTDIKFQA